MKDNWRLHFLTLLWFTVKTEQPVLFVNPWFYWCSLQLQLYPHKGFCCCCWFDFLFCFQLISCLNKKTNDVQMLLLFSSRKNTKHFKARILGIIAKSPSSMVQGHRILEWQEFRLWKLQARSSLLLCDPVKEVYTFTASFPHLQVGECPCSTPLDRLTLSQPS